MKKKVLLFLMLAVSIRLFAVIAMPGSGVYGDEYYHYRMDINGVIQTASISSQIQHRHLMPSIETSFPTKGDVKSIVILAEYKDVRFTVSNPKDAFTRMLNEQGYNDNGGTGSARDYFIYNSYNGFRPDFEVYGPYVLPHDRAYYKDKAAQMIVDACEAADDDGVDFTQYDVNGDGNIDNVFVYYAGHNPAEGGPESAVWPHRSQAYIWNDKEQKYFKYSVDDVWIIDYACTSELYGSSGSRMCGIGTFCHEFSHVLGLDDLYNTVNSDVYTIGTWDIMCQGNYNNEGRTPPGYSAFERWMLGWLEPVQIKSTADYMLEPVEIKPQAYLIAASDHNIKVKSPNPKEYWLLENRQAVGWDNPKSCLPGTGLLISHIVFNEGKWNNNTPNNTLPLGYDLCEAYYKTPYYSSASDTYPGIYNITDFVPVSSTGDTLYEHPLSRIQSIPTFEGDNIVFHYGEDNGSGLHISADRMTLMRSAVLDGKVTAASSLVLAEGAHLQDSKMFVTTDNPQFQISLDSINWTSDTIWDVINEDSTYNHKIYVRYYPTESCMQEIAILRVSTGDGVQMSQSVISGESYRPILIDKVEPQEATDITAYGFVAHWNEQTDAETYSLTLYRADDEDYSVAEKADIVFSANQEQYLTNVTDLPIKDITFAVTNTFALGSGNTTAEIVVEALFGDSWVKVGQVPVRMSNYGKSHTVVMPSDGIYTRIRLTNMLTGEGELNIRNLNLRLVGKPEYIYKGDELTLTGQQVRLTDLLPDTDYYYYLTCSEEKGCERHTSDRGNVVKVRTHSGISDTERRFTIGRNGDGYVAWFSHPATEGNQLMICDAAGQCLYVAPIEKGSVSMAIPAYSLSLGQVYIVKIVNSGKLKHKGLQAKFIYK